MSTRTPIDPKCHPSVKSEFQSPEALRDAYKRHATELLAIEEQQSKLLLVILGIFSAGATLLSSSKLVAGSRMTWPVQIGLTVITLSIFWLWKWHTQERHEYRQAVRDLLVRCELGLGFYTDSAYLSGTTLYTSEELLFPTKGRFLRWSYFGPVALVATGFLLALWSPQLQRLLCL
jgi:hypothetical protein